MKIQIPQPCHENWNEMNLQQKGRFCGSCQKVVIDFTTMSDSEIVNHFKNYKGNTCGRFYDTQLNTNLVSLKPRKSTFWSKLVAASFTLFFFSSQSYSQNTILKTEVIESNQSDKNEDDLRKTSTSDYFQIKGRVIDASKKSISDALVSIQETPYSIITDKHGNFEFNITKTEIQNQDSTVLQVQKFGYTTLSLQIDFDTENTTHSYLELIIEEAVILEEEGIKQIREVITMGMTSATFVEEYDSLPKNNNSFDKKAEVKVIEKKSLWQHFKSIFF
ncbi:carboxypeptidase-like regulatory domain-containing protein [Bernardetia sp. ABR2-2B]|uniref:carboxypeptidase-like regulatory domain-containing protein n=1 Tax=Bernardetia sp. ABR2-2B TaxID=3127472 RepID=UPI0030D60A21